MLMTTEYFLSYISTNYILLWKKVIFELLTYSDQLQQYSTWNSDDYPQPFIYLPETK